MSRVTITPSVNSANPDLFDIHVVATLKMANMSTFMTTYILDRSTRNNFAELASGRARKFILDSPKTTVKISFDIFDDTMYFTYSVENESIVIILPPTQKRLIYQAFHELVALMDE